LPALFGHKYIAIGDHPQYILHRLYLF
jgi:hypothetical protein